MLAEIIIQPTPIGIAILAMVGVACACFGCLIFYVLMLIVQKYSGDKEVITRLQTDKESLRDSKIALIKENYELTNKVAELTETLEHRDAVIQVYRDKLAEATDLTADLKHLIRKEIPFPIQQTEHADRLDQFISRKNNG